MRQTHPHTNRSSRRSFVSTVTIFLLCAMAIVHLNFAVPGVQNAIAEDGNPPCPGGCPGDTIPPFEPMIDEEPVETGTWYLSLLLLAF